MRRHAFLLLLVLLIPLAAAAQGEDTTASRRELSPRITPAFGLHYGSPLRFSGALGVIIDLDKKSLDGILLVAEPGQKGIEFSTGYLKMIGRFGSGVSIRASAPIKSFLAFEIAPCTLAARYNLSFRLNSLIMLLTMRSWSSASKITKLLCTGRSSASRRNNRAQIE